MPVSFANTSSDETLDAVVSVVVVIDVVIAVADVVAAGFTIAATVVTLSRGCCCR